MEQLFELHRLDAGQCYPPVDEVLVDHLHRGAHRRLRRALTRARLQHEEPPPLDGELHVLHVEEMLFQPSRDLEQFLENLRECFFERGVTFLSLGLGNTLALGSFSCRGETDLQRRPNPRDDIFALGVGQKLTVDTAFAGRRISRKGYSGRAVPTEIAEHHRLHGDSRTPVARNIVELAIGDRAIIVPRTKDCPYRLPQLLSRILRHVATDTVTDKRAKLVH